MVAKSLCKILLVGVAAAAISSPALAVKHVKHVKHVMHTPRPCAKAELRCIADCDKYHWCHVYTCIGSETFMVPVPCNEDAGLCFAPHC